MWIAFLTLLALFSTIASIGLLFWCKQQEDDIGELTEREFKTRQRVGQIEIALSSNQNPKFEGNEDWLNFERNS